MLSQHMVAPLVLVLLESQACSPPADYSLARQACGLASGEVVPVPYDVTIGALTSMSDACGRHLGDAIGIDWDTFEDSTVGATGVETTQDALLGAEFVLLSANLGTVGQTLSAPALPHWLFETFSDLSESFGLADGASAGWLWYGLVTDRIRRSRLAPEELNSDATASYAHGVLTLSDWVASPPSENIHTMNAAATLVHESAHRSQPPHRSGEEWGDSASEFDPDTEGAYGAEAWFLGTWMLGLDRSDPDQQRLCRHACIDCACHHIQNVDGYPPCELGVEELCGDWEAEPESPSAPAWRVE